MHEVEIKKGKAKHIVKFYDSDRVLPMRRYQKFNKHMMIALGVGDSIEDYARLTSKGVAYLNDGDIQSASIEITNRMQTVYNALQEYSPKGYALAVMVKSIDDVVYESFDEGTLDKIQTRLDEIGFTKQMQDETIDLLKKK